VGDRPTAPGQQSLQLILARNLISTLSTAAFLVDTASTVVFYNDAAADFIGMRYEETGKVALSVWREALDPADEDGRAIADDDMPISVALRDGRPVHRTAVVRVAGTEPRGAELLALPLIGPEGNFEGAVGVFWVQSDAAG
jgi:PAS domain-containing protein